MSRPGKTVPDMPFSADESAEGWRRNHVKGVDYRTQVTLLDVIDYDYALKG
jgi:hypothetical protein